MYLKGWLWGINDIIHKKCIHHAWYILYTQFMLPVISCVYYLLYTLENSDPQVGVWGGAIGFSDRFSRFSYFADY